MKRPVLKLPAPNTLVKTGTVDEFQTPRLGKSRGQSVTLVKTRQKGALQNTFQSLPCLCESDHGLNVASAGVLHSDNFPWGLSYAMSICLGMGLNRPPHLSEACCIHQRPWRDQFSSCQLQTHLSKEALWMNSRLGCFPPLLETSCCSQCRCCQVAGSSWKQAQYLNDGGFWAPNGMEMFGSWQPQGPLAFFAGLQTLQGFGKMFLALLDHQY